MTSLHNVRVARLLTNGGAIRGRSLIITVGGASNKWYGISRESMTPPLLPDGLRIYDPLSEGSGIYDLPPHTRKPNQQKPPLLYDK